MEGEGGTHPDPIGAKPPSGSISPRQIQKSITSESSAACPQHPSSLVASGSALSGQSEDTDDTKSASMIGSSPASLPYKSKKKRYATQHEARWLKEGQLSDPILKPTSSLTDQTLPTLPPVLPQNQTPPSVGSTVSPALSILGSTKYARMSPGHDAPAIHPGTPSAYLATQPLNHDSLQIQKPRSEAMVGDDLSAINEEQTIRDRSVSPSSSSPQDPQPEPPKLRREWLKLFQRNR
ncbi:unnamed protein product [Clonostachys rosea]|uniref:Uncharacterized protein n=1 Tax=Bionectria ochroleuca TaxID=29856 RepID=A0ABY6UKC0_BIOOC|nr:unnamed protein product [Clonostachys rosea]